jgi:anthranilate phosphoribosyltransferase
MSANNPEASKSPLQIFLARLMAGENLSRVEAVALLDTLLNGNASDAQIAATLTALKLKGETVEELAGLAPACAGTQFV